MEDMITSETLSAGPSLKPLSSENLKINCLVFGESSDRAFCLRIDSGDSISEMRELIHSQYIETQLRSSIRISDLIIFRLDEPVHPGDARINQISSHTVSDEPPFRCTKCHPLAKIGEYFNSATMVYGNNIQLLVIISKKNPAQTTQQFMAEGVNFKPTQPTPVRTHQIVNIAPPPSNNTFYANGQPRAVAPSQFVCKWNNACGNVYPTGDQLKNHISEAHIGRAMNGNLCLECLWPDGHVNSKRTFKKRNQIVQHMTTHIDEKPFMCKICPAVFKRPQDLKKHERGHRIAEYASSEQAKMESMKGKSEGVADDFINASKTLYRMVTNPAEHPGVNGYPQRQQMLTPQFHPYPTNFPIRFDGMPAETGYVSIHPGVGASLYPVRPYTGQFYAPNTMYMKETDYQMYPQAIQQNQDNKIRYPALENALENGTAKRPGEELLDDMEKRQRVSQTADIAIEEEAVHVEAEGTVEPVGSTIPKVANTGMDNSQRIQETPEPPQPTTQAQLPPPLSVNEITDEPIVNDSAELTVPADNQSNADEEARSENSMSNASEQDHSKPQSSPTEEKPKIQDYGLNFLAEACNLASSNETTFKKSIKDRS
ncbi:hypothetical protein HK098_001323 [Nowakowskiella sp. JEL0407]|nr:hypothetical protein HK098_001323 [Nowakowskiella sp. JEL0407]